MWYLLSVFATVLGSFIFAYFAIVVCLPTPIPSLPNLTRLPFNFHPQFFIPVLLRLVLDLDAQRNTISWIQQRSTELFCQTLFGTTCHLVDIFTFLFSSTDKRVVQMAQGPRISPLLMTVLPLRTDDIVRMEWLCICSNRRYILLERRGLLTANARQLRPRLLAHDFVALALALRVYHFLGVDRLAGV